MKINFEWNNELYIVEESAKEASYIKLPNGIYLKVLEWDGVKPSKVIYTEKAPPGWEGTVLAMKKHPELNKGKTKEGKEKNIYALAWYMKNKGDKPHYEKKKGKPVKKIKYKNESFLEWFKLKEMANSSNVLPSKIRKSINLELSHPHFPTYWDKPGKAITYISNILSRSSINIVQPISFNDSLPTHKENYNIEFNGVVVDNILVFYWYRTENGRFEINAYIS